METKLSLKQALFVVGVMIVVIFLATNTKLDGNLVQTAPGFPTNLTIPSINVSATIEPVGLAAGGDMDVPKLPTNTAWFKFGPRPGEIGSAVIDGHFGWKNNIPAVFDNLSELKKGDKIYVEDDKGVTTIFIVRELKIFGDKEKTTDVFSSGDDKAHLNLITCEGIYNKVTKSYSGRLVVFADKK